MAKLPEAPSYTPPEVAAAMADVNLRRQHKYRNGWSRADQRDQNAWERHDSNEDLWGNPLVHGMPYGICTICEYLRKVEADADQR